jgi:hypothetical protein
VGKGSKDFKVLKFATMLYDRALFPPQQLLSRMVQGSSPYAQGAARSFMTNPVNPIKSCYPVNYPVNPLPWRKQ